MAYSDVQNPGIEILSSGGGGGGLVSSEIPSGVVNGVNVTFTVSNTPIYIEVSGQVMVSQTIDPSNYGFTYSAGTITFVNAPSQTPHSFFGASLLIEIPSGTVDSSNVTFVVAHLPLYIEVSGQTMVSQTTDPSQYGYTYSSGTVTFVIAPTQTPHSFYTT